MKKKIIDFLSNVWDEIDYRLRLLCGKPTPMKRFIVVLIFGTILSVGYFYTIISSIYRMGKREAEKELMELQHIEGLKLQHENDSINIFNQEEYECN